MKYFAAFDESDNIWGVGETHDEAMRDAEDWYYGETEDMQEILGGLNVLPITTCLYNLIGVYGNAPEFMDISTRNGVQFGHVNIEKLLKWSKKEE